MHYITLNKLAEAIVGDSEFRNVSPYRTWDNMYKFFFLLDVPELTKEECEEHNVTSRVKYSAATLKKLDNTQIKKVIEELFSDIYYVNCDYYNKTETMNCLNKYLSHEKLEIRSVGNNYSLYNISDSIINEVKIPFEKNEEITKDFIINQIEKAQKRIEESDYSGAITSAKSLIEGIFSYIDKEINQQQTINPKDDLIKQYSSIKNILNLDPSQKKLSDSLKQILQGLNSIVCGLSFFRNKMSDAHLPQYKAQKHHAILAVNAANTLSQFLLDTYQYQKQRKVMNT